MPMRTISITSTQGGDTDEEVVLTTDDEEEDADGHTRADLLRAFLLTQAAEWLSTH